MNPSRNTPQTPVTRGERVLALAGLAVALPATPVMTLLSVPPPVIGGVWAVALAWTVLASLGHALWLGVARGDRSRFDTRCDGPERARRETLDWSTKTGSHAYRRIREHHETLTRNGGGDFR